jgi:predicted ATP-grasp superfamily ATP-dependent carboligase
MEISAPPRVLIASSSDWEGLSRAPYLYAQAGWEVEAFVSSKSFLAHSSYVRQLHATEASPSDFAEQLGEYVQKHGSAYDKIIIGDDPLLWELAKRRDKAWARSLLPCAGSDKEINFIISKLDFIRRCTAHGIPLPRSIICRTSAEVRAAALSTGFPLVLKQDQGYGGEGVKVIESMRELDEFTPTSEVLIQKFVEGQICSAAILYKHGKLLGYFSYVRSRTWGALGASTAIQFRVFPELQKILEDLGGITSFDGQCGVDFMCEHATSKVLILEQNFRPTLTMLLGKRVGVDFSELLRHWDTPPEQPVSQNPAMNSELPFFPTDVVSAIASRDFVALLRWLVNPLWLRELNWHDRKLLRHNLKYIYTFTKDKFRRFLNRNALTNVSL